MKNWGRKEKKKLEKEREINLNREAVDSTLATFRFNDGEKVKFLIGDVQLGQEIEAKVLKFDQEKHRVSLGLKQLWAVGKKQYLF